MAKLAFRTHGLAGIHLHSDRLKQTSHMVIVAVRKRLAALVSDENMAMYRRVAAAVWQEWQWECQGLRRWLGVTPRQAQLCARVSLVCFCLAMLCTAAWFAVVNRHDREPAWSDVRVVNGLQESVAPDDKGRLAKKVHLKTRHGTKTFYVIRDDNRADK